MCFITCEFALTSCIFFDTTGLRRVQCPTLVIGVQSDMLFPVWQQREIATILREGILVLPPLSCIPGAELS